MLNLFNCHKMNTSLYHLKNLKNNKTSKFIFNNSFIKIPMKNTINRENVNILKILNSFKINLMYKKMIVIYLSLVIDIIVLILNKHSNNLSKLVIFKKFN